jgi:RNA polymerase primary sigma factor
MVLERTAYEWKGIAQQDTWRDLLENALGDRDQVTLEELLALLPAPEENLDLLELVMEELAQRGIEVVEEVEAKELDEPEEPSTYEAPPLEAIPPDDLLSVYLAEMSREPLLSRDEEVNLARQIEVGRLAEETLLQTDYTSDEFERLQCLAEAGQAAREHLAQANTRLVISIAKRYRNRGLPFPDLIQEGNVGLMRAVDRYDPESGNRFSTYATWWIRQAVTRSLENHGRVIRIPVHTGARMREMGYIAQRMEMDLGRTPTSEEIAVEMDEPVAKIHQLMQWAHRPLSLEQPFGEEGDAELGDFLQDEEAQPPEEVIDSHLLEERLRDLLKILTVREARILRMRYGLDDGQMRTLSDVAKSFGLSRERIRQIEREAFAKIRLVAPRLGDFLEAA